LLLATNCAVLATTSRGGTHLGVTVGAAACTAPDGSIQPALVARAGRHDQRRTVPASVVLGCLAGLVLASS
jgi:hypothetical protein